MAEPLKRERPLDVCESAVGILRQTGLRSLTRQWAGSVPFALGLLVAWKQAENPRLPDIRLALEALGLSLLLIWMSSCRAVSAGYVRRHLNREPTHPRTRTELLRLIAVQSFASGTKLVVLPFAALIVFPLPQVIAFYRNIDALADRQTLDARAIISRARHLSRVQPEQSWLTIPLLLLFGLMVFLNMAAAIGGAPQIVRMLTGYESTFSRSETGFLFNPMYFMLAGCSTWILFDPFVQTVYSLRCHQAEASENGADVKAGIRRLREKLATVSVAALIAGAFFAIAPACRASIAPNDMQHAAERAATATEYDWRLPPPARPAHQRPWLIDATDRALAGVRKATDALGKLIDRLFSWLFDKISGRPESTGKLPVGGMHWTIYALLGLVVVAGAVVAIRLVRAARPRQVTASEGVPGAITLDADDLAADRLPEEEWLVLAEEALAAGKSRLGLRALYLATLAWMGRSGYLSIHAGKTNHEYELDLKRRLRTSPDARALFGVNVRVFERAWYGLHEVENSEIEEFRARMDRLKAIISAMGSESQAAA